MLGMMVNIFSKQNENENVKTQVISNTDRIDQLEAKIGDSKDVAYPRSIAIRRLPLPPHGVTELQNAQHYLKEIKAQGVDISKDAVKAVRKEAARHNPNLGPNLGTVLVELKSEEVRGKIMKSKKTLETHPAEVVKELIIKNALTPAEMKAQNTNTSMLKMITGGNDHYIAGNGMIYQKNQNNQQYPHQSRTQSQRFHAPLPNQHQHPKPHPPNHAQPQHYSQPQQFSLTQKFQTPLPNQPQPPSHDQPQHYSQPQQFASSMPYRFQAPLPNQFQPPKPNLRPQSHGQPQAPSSLHLPQRYTQPQQFTHSMPYFMPQSTSQFPQPPSAPYNFQFTTHPPTVSQPTYRNPNHLDNLMDFEFTPVSSNQSQEAQISSPSRTQSEASSPSQAQSSQNQTDGRRSSPGQ